MKLDKEKIERHLEAGWIRKAQNEEGLMQFDYTKVCTYENKWDETTSICRGIILDKDYNIVCPCMPKFFNFSQYSPEKQKEIALRKDFYSTKKYDGTLTFLYFYNDKLHINSKCSFDSFVTKEAWNIVKNTNLDTKFRKLYNNLGKMVLICETISPETKILVDYGETRELVLLTSYKYNEDINEWKEIDYDTLISISKDLDLHLTERTKMSFEELINWQKTHDFTEEGFVVVYSDGLRVKFKSNDYLRVAAVKEYLDEKHLIGVAIENSDKDYYEALINRIKDLPDELQKEALEIAKNIQNKFYNLYQKIDLEYQETKDNTDKEIGLNKNLNYKTEIFLLRKDKNINKNILKRIESEIK